MSYVDALQIADDLEDRRDSCRNQLTTNLKVDDPVGYSYLKGRGDAYDFVIRNIYRDLAKGECGND